MNTEPQIPALPGSETEAASPAPHSIEAEQALLGALLVNNEVHARIEDILQPEHFYDPVHRRLYEIIDQRIKSGALASPVTVKPFVEDDPGLAELGGPAYLARLAGASISIFAARDYAEMIRDLALRRELIALGTDLADQARRIEVGDEAEGLITEAERKLYALAEKGHVARGFVSFAQALREAVDVAHAAYRRDGHLAGISTGLRALDDKLGGLHKSDLLILAGRPSMGKTALATNIAFNIARNHRTEIDDHGNRKTVAGGVVGFFSLEMSSEQLAARILSEAARVPSDRIRKGTMDEEEFRRLIRAAQELEKSPLYIDDTPALTIGQIAARARRLKRTHGLDVLFIDYLQLARPSSSRPSDGRVQEVSEITQGLKAIAKELDIPVVALSQLSRQVESREDKRPQLSDLRESGSIEQDADVVMFVFREEYYREREKPSESDHDAFLKWQQIMEQVHGKAEIIIGKQRHGPIGTVELAFDGTFTRFYDRAPEGYEEIAAQGPVGADPRHADADEFGP